MTASHARVDELADAAAQLCDACYGDRGPRAGVRDMAGPARFGHCHRLAGHPNIGDDGIGHSDQPEHFAR